MAGRHLLPARRGSLCGRFLHPRVVRGLASGDRGRASGSWSADLGRRLRHLRLAGTMPGSRGRHRPRGDGTGVSSLTGVGDEGPSTRAGLGTAGRGRARRPPSHFGEVLGVTRISRPAAGHGRCGAEARAGRPRRRRRRRADRGCPPVGRSRSATRRAPTGGRGGTSPEGGSPGGGAPARLAGASGPLSSPGWRAVP